MAGGSPNPRVAAVVENDDMGVCGNPNLLSGNREDEVEEHRKRRRVAFHRPGGVLGTVCVCV